ncbi:DUF4468 domain-containing protein [Dysgonomonas sp. ZJ709]|uniref:DUF4468 domain-containing protein n=1 Tax=Dysgonomonas sp. ZJ709 TaxID=2709797 RepID=UPI0013EC1D58|nr:DUF4468 domain-containing protein [Dysgonomonas sp. ZJ709]
MKSYILLFTALFFSIVSLVNAQENTKYLAGAVSETNGKVVFTKSIQPSSKLSGDELFDKVNEWAEIYFGKNNQNPDQRILLSDSEKKQIACIGSIDLVFAKRVLMLDKAVMSYQMILNIENDICNATIRNIKYEYNTGKDTETLAAEDMITDKIAVHKNGQKLNTYYGKFRTATIDSVNQIFNALNQHINGHQNTMSSSGSLTPPIAVIPEVKENTAGATLPGFKNISPQDIPENIIKLLNEAALITSGKGESTNVMTASWGGLGVLWEKPISMCFLNPTRYSIKTMDEGETYTISFYTPAYKDVIQYCGTTSGKNTDKIKGSGLTPIKTPSGATAFSEASMIFECRKLVAQPISEAGLKIDKSELPDSFTKDGLHKMYIGEILNVWVK